MLYIYIYKLTNYIILRKIKTLKKSKKEMGSLKKKGHLFLSFFKNLTKSFAKTSMIFIFKAYCFCFYNKGENVTA